MVSLATLNAERQEQLDAYREKMTRAKSRCEEASRSERVLGFDSSALSYELMADELLRSYWWLIKVLPV